MTAAKVAQRTPGPWHVVPFRSGFALSRDTGRGSYELFRHPTQGHQVWFGNADTAEAARAAIAKAS